MNMKAIITILLIIVLSPLATKADIIKGRVVDSETKEPLPEAQVGFVQNNDNGWWVMTPSAASASLPQAEEA